MLVRTLAVGLLASALSVVAPSPSTADEVRGLDLSGFSEMVVDREHERIFISQGNGGVVVLGLDGLQIRARWFEGPSLRRQAVEAGRVQVRPLTHERVVCLGRTPRRSGRSA